MADWPPSLKAIGKYIVRAREVQRTQPLIAYYCNYYALKRAIQLRDKSDERANRLVTGLLDKCEAAKATVGVDDGSHRGIVEEFALSVFDRADMEDREDRATKETAQTFYAAVCFFEVCSVFGPLTSDLDQRLRYAKWKAVDISKALKEGRRPLPGAPGEAEALEEQRLATEREHASAEQPTTRSLPPETGPDTDFSQEPGAAYPQEDLQVPPAPEVREYDSDLQEYQPQPLSRRQSGGAGPYPSVAPPYPSADISPIAKPQKPNTPPGYPSVNSAYPTTDNSYGTFNSAYPTTTGYPAPSAPHMAPSAPYASVDAPHTESSKRPQMPPIPSLDLPGIGTNMGDPPVAQQQYPSRSNSVHARPPPSDSGHASPTSDLTHSPPRSNLVRVPSRSDPTYSPPRSDLVRVPSRSDPTHSPPRSDLVRVPSRSNPMYTAQRPDPAYATQRSNPVYTTQRSEPVHHEPPQAQSLYAPRRSEPTNLHPRSDASYPLPSDPNYPPPTDPSYPPPADPSYPPPSEAFAAQPPGMMPLQAPVPAAEPVKTHTKTGGAVPEYKPSISETQEAQRLAKYAASALDFQDLKTAVANLEDALGLLKGTR